MKGEWRVIPERTVFEVERSIRMTPIEHDIAYRWGKVRSAKVEKFLNEVRKLCRKHKMQIAVTGYDGICINDLEPGDDEIYAQGIDDYTKT